MYPLLHSFFSLCVSLAVCLNQLIDVSFTHFLFPSLCLSPLPQDNQSNPPARERECVRESGFPLLFDALSQLSCPILSYFTNISRNLQAKMTGLNAETLQAIETCRVRMLHMA